MPTETEREQYKLLKGAVKANHVRLMTMTKEDGTEHAVVCAVFAGDNGGYDLFPSAVLTLVNLEDDWTLTDSAGNTFHTEPADPLIGLNIAEEAPEE